MAAHTVSEMKGCTMLITLDSNDITISVDNEKLSEIFLNIAAEKATANDLLLWVKKHSE